MNNFATFGARALLGEHLSQATYRTKVRKCMAGPHGSCIQTSRSTALKQSSAAASGHSNEQLEYTWKNYY